MLYSRIVGVRTDIDLRTRWWHRLVTVVYVILFGLVALLMLFFSTDAQPDARVENIRETANLEDIIKNAPATANAAHLFADAPGAFGIRRFDGRIDYLSSFYWDQSRCAREPLRAAAELARPGETPEQFSQALIKQYGPAVPTLCWFDGTLKDQIGDSPWAFVLKYEFSDNAKTYAKVAAFIKVALGLALAHLIFALAYYRGFVYVVCGPRPSRANVTDSTAAS